MTIEDARNNIGSTVIYTPFEGCGNELKELGTIVSVSDNVVYVYFGSKVSSRGDACRPCDLEFGGIHV